MKVLIPPRSAVRACRILVFSPPSFHYPSTPQEPMPKKKGKEDGSSKEVEELLSAAQDHMLLDLRIGSHSTRDASSLDGDLHRRFEALKKPSLSSSARTTTISPLPEKTAKKTSRETVAVSGGEVDDELNRALGADLAARFAVLKGISSSPASSTESVVTPEKLNLEKEEEEEEEDDDDDDVDEDGVSKKEVDKLIQWATDAARLDPSLNSDDDDENEDEDDEHVRKDQSKENKGKSLRDQASLTVLIHGNALAQLYIDKKEYPSSILKYSASASSAPGVVKKHPIQEAYL
ncbi:hypothetical protein ACLOJK_032206 [Asimina triloba]